MAPLKVLVFGLLIFVPLLLLFRTDETSLIVLVSSLPTIAPSLLLLLFVDKSSSRYRTCWWWFAFLLAIVCLIAFLYVMWMPFFSSHRRGVSNPGGPSGNMLVGLLFLLFVASVVIPSFPTLFLLGLFPPKSYSHKKRRKIQKIVPIGVVLLASLMFIKFRVYMADYHGYRNRPGPSAVERLEHQKEVAERRERTRKEREAREEREERERIEAMSETERAEWEMLQRKWEENTKKKKAERAVRDAKRRAEIAEQRIEKWRANLDD